MVNLMTQQKIASRQAEANREQAAPEKRQSLPDFAGRLMDYEEALAKCLSAVAETLSPEPVALVDSLGRVLREKVESPLAVPSFNKSTMDGYAVKSVDVEAATTEAPVVLRVVDEVPAGGFSSKTLRSGEAVRIMTGAAVPEGADAVIKIEKTEAVDQTRISILDGVGENNYIIPRGRDLLPGQEVASPGLEIDPIMIGILASCGIAEIKVSRKPAIGIISTGSELVPPGQVLPEGCIYDINGYFLHGFLQKAGVSVSPPERVSDKSAELLAALERNSDKDILLLSGGVSVGDYDIVHETLQKAGVREIFWRVRVKPGKPLFFGQKGQTLIFGLPGNPVSSATNFFLFVKPVIDKLLGKKEWGLPSGYARVLNSRILRPGRRKFLKGEIRTGAADQRVWIIPEQRSGVFSPMKEADVFIEVPEHVKLVKEGELVKVHYLPK